MSPYTKSRKKQHYGKLPFKPNVKKYQLHICKTDLCVTEKWKGILPLTRGTTSDALGSRGRVESVALIGQKSHRTFGAGRARGLGGEWAAIGYRLHLFLPRMVVFGWWANQLGKHKNGREGGYFPLGAQLGEFKGRDPLPGKRGRYKNMKRRGKYIHRTYRPPGPKT